MSCDWPKALPMGSRDAHDFVCVRAGADGFSDRIDVREKLFRDVGADETDRRVVQVIGFGDVAAGGEADVAELGVVGGRAHHSVFSSKVLPERMSMVTQPAAATRLAIFMLSRTHSNSSSVKQRALLRFDPFVFAGDDSKTVHHVHIRAEVGDAVGHVEVQPGDDAHDRHQR